MQASEALRRAYDHTCRQLRHQFEKNLSSQVTDKTRAVAKDLHSQMSVALQSVNSISKKIEKMRDEELHPQLVELMQGYVPTKQSVSYSIITYINLKNTER